MCGWICAVKLLCLCVAESQSAILPPVILSFKLKTMCIARRHFRSLRGGWAPAGSETTLTNFSIAVLAITFLVCYSLIRGYINLLEFHEIQSKINRLQESVTGLEGDTVTQAENVQKQNSVLKDIIKLYVQKDELTSKIISRNNKGCPD